MMYCIKICYSFIGTIYTGSGVYLIDTSLQFFVPDKMLYTLNEFIEKRYKIV